MPFCNSKLSSIVRYFSLPMSSMIIVFTPFKNADALALIISVSTALDE
jgi:hypothetical protein